LVFSIDAAPLVGKLLITAGAVVLVVQLIVGLARAAVDPGDGGTDV
jgi:hypothetical protein